MSDTRAGGLVAEGVWARRGDRDVLRGVSATIPSGAVTALVAPSGAGKSTLLRCMTRLLDIDRGTIALAGTDIRVIAPRELRHRIGLVSQTPVMLPGSVGDNVGYGLGAAQGDREGRIRAALEAAGLNEGFAGRDAAELSGGEQARVAIARAIIRDPQILLLDEPTAALDAATAEPIGETLRRLAGDGLGIGMATHDLAFAERFAVRVVELGPGGTPEADA